MRVRLLILLLWIAGVAGEVYGQEVTVSGEVTDAESGEVLPEANVVDTRTQIGSYTNQAGRFELSLPADRVVLRISFVGYKAKEHTFVAEQDTTLNIALNPVLETEEIRIRAEGDPIEETTQMGRTELSPEIITQTPGLLGESDVIQTIELLPGVQSGTEGSSGFYVRGGGPDQNLVLMDGVPVYNISHLFGFFSVFNTPTIEETEFYKGDFPARYGGRASSVVDVTKQAGNTESHRGEGGIGLAATDMTLEGPLGGNTTYMISGRRSYIDVLARPFLADEDESGGYYFWDGNAKIRHRFSEDNRLYFSMYGGDDRFHFDLTTEDETETGRSRDRFDFDMGWGNRVSSLRWNHFFSDHMFADITLSYSGYEFEIEGSEAYEHYEDGELEDEGHYIMNYTSGIQNAGLGADFEYDYLSDHHIRFGAQLQRQWFSPGALQLSIDDDMDRDEIDAESDVTDTSLQYAVYAEDEFTLNPLWKFSYGLRHTGFSAGDRFYPSVQPRFSARRMLRRNWSVKASYAYMVQHVHLLSNSFAGLPTDLWVPVTEDTPPQTAHHLSVGTSATFGDNAFEVTVEAFYKSMGGLIDYREGAQFMGFGESWEDNIESGGQGEAYGFEILLRRNVGSTTGWIGYTLSRTTRKFEEINDGEPYPYKFDRRHDVSVTLNHRLTESWDISGTWIYGTGNAMTVPLNQHQRNLVGRPVQGDPGDLIEYYGSRNGFREPAYHRLDLSINHHRERSWGERTLSVGAYNVYNRQNPFFIRLNEAPGGGREAQQISLFPVIPAVNYRFRF